MQPGRVYHMDIEQGVTAVRILAGHQLRIEVAGSNFPAYERNLQSGGENSRESEPRRARITIWHSPKQPSFVEFSILPRESRTARARVRPSA